MKGIPFFPMGVVWGGWSKHAYMATIKENKGSIDTLFLRSSISSSYNWLEGGRRINLSYFHGKSIFDEFEGFSLKSYKV